MSYIPSREGHAPGHLREPFVEWASENSIAGEFAETVSVGWSEETRSLSRRRPSRVGELERESDRSLRWCPSPDIEHLEGHRGHTPAGPPSSVLNSGAPATTRRSRQAG